jgi:hypothetical protein
MCLRELLHASSVVTKIISMGVQQRLYRYGLIIFIILNAGLGVRAAMAQTATPNPCSPLTTSQGSAISLDGAKLQQSRVTNPQAVIDTDAATSAILQPTKDVASAYLSVTLPKTMVVTRINLTVRPEDATTAKVNGYAIVAGCGTPTPSNPNTTTWGAPVSNFYWHENLQNVGIDAAHTLVFSRVVNTQNKQVPTNFIYIYSVTSDGHPLGITNIKLEGYDPNPKGMTVNGSVSLSGYSDLKLDAVSIFNYATNQKLATTDDNGNYTITSLSANTAIRLRAERDGFKVQTQSLTPHSGDNQLDFSLKLADDNVITGRLTDNAGKPVSSFVMALKDGHRLRVGASNPLDGTYTIKGLLPGTYQLVARDNFDDQDNLPTVPGVITVTLNKKYDETATKDIILAQPRANPIGYQLKVTALAYNYGYSSILAQGDPEVKGARIEVKPINIPTQSVRLGTSSTTFPNMSPGTYSVTVTQTGYTAQTQTVTINRPGVTFADVHLNGKKSGCLLSSRDNVKEFWLCGSEAQAMKDDERVAMIDRTIGQLRTQYGYKDLPLEVVIDSSKGTNASYYPGYDNGKNPTTKCPVPLTGDKDNPKSGEHMEFLTGNLKERTADQVAQVTTHEWGHGKSTREAKCQGKRSGQPDFLMLREVGERFSTQFFLPLHDGIYNDQVASDGHPEASPDETYASSFIICQLHRDEFNNNINGLAKPLKQTLQKIGNITLSGGPNKCSI